MCVCTCACVCVKNKEHACARAYSSRISITQYIHPCHKNRSTQCTSSGRRISVLYNLCGSDILVRLWDQSCVREVARVHACVHACALTYSLCGSDILVRLWDQSCVREVARVHACVHACALTYAFLRVLCA